MTETIEDKLARLRVAIAEILDARNALRTKVQALSEVGDSFFADGMIIGYFADGCYAVWEKAKEERGAFRVRVAELEAAQDEPVLRTPPKRYGEALVPESRVKALIEAGDAMARVMRKHLLSPAIQTAWEEARDGD